MVLRDAEQLKKMLVEILPDSELYPQEWKRLSDAPKALYALGNVALLKRRKFCIVGSRRTPANALKLGEKIAEELAGSFVLVTGTADGGDAAAIEGALRGGGRLICVLAGGFSSLPQGNLSLLEQVAERGLLLSPHSFETSVRSFSYEYRNKLLAAVSEGVLSLGAGEKSGALITAKYAEKFKKPIFAFPYPPNSAAGAGNNALIKNGGYLTESATDIFEKMGIADPTLLGQKSAPVLSEGEAKLYQALQELTEAHVNELTAKSGVPIFKARALLSSLEVKGLVVGVGGNRYSLV